ncbi:MAG TPA: formate dehydrogenase accessory sulfurtransferase FdhD [Stellaceae bacterium]|nr:formate dehydrogenase accessory sulfurtransferase FdhD [Stellaceae bacterium]
MLGPTRTVERTAWRAGGLAVGERVVPEETAVAFTYNGASYAVMMATPQDLEDFAFGFSLTEGIIASPGDVDSLEIVEQSNGLELRMYLTEPHATTFHERRRYLAGPAGCGLCGIESLSEAMRQPLAVSDESRVTPIEIMAALNALHARQAINRITHAVHGAAFYRKGSGLLALREDIGRHNALDKLAGALARRGIRGRSGIGILTSRLSVELVQKAAAIGIPVLVAVSAPTTLAIRTAEASGITLVAVARNDGFEIFTHRQRIEEEQAAHAFI